MATYVRSRAGRLVQGVRVRNLDRIVTLIALGLTVAVIAPAVRDVLVVWTQGPWGGVDYHQYMDATKRWVEGGPFYEPYQLVGPYEVRYPAILYPPVALWLFVPFLWLPAALWWVIPGAAFGLMLYRLRPRAWSWPIMALLASWTPSLMSILTGNPGMWVAAAMAIGVVYAGPAVFVLIKPSLFPFALWGAWHRRWWLSLGLFALMAAPFGAMWRDWLIAILNSRDGPWGGGLFYSAPFAAILAIPLVAWLARTTTTGVDAPSRAAAITRVLLNSAEGPGRDPAPQTPARAVSPEP